MPKGVYPHTHIKPKAYPAEQVAEVKRRYWDDGMSIEEVAVAMSLGTKVIRRLMVNHGIPRRPRAARSQKGPSNNAWRGDGASYNALHSRVERARGKPDHCEKCGASGPDRQYEWANMTGHYEDIDDYWRICVPCHRTLDAGRRAATGKNTTPDHLRKEVMPVPSAEAVIDLDLFAGPG